MISTGTLFRVVNARRECLSSEFGVKIIGLLFSMFLFLFQDVLFLLLKEQERRPERQREGDRRKEKEREVSQE